MPLSAVQKASFCMSVEWKRQSHNLLYEARTLQDFKEAVIWCGKEGNVIRTVPTSYVEEYASYLFERKAAIMGGTFVLSELPNFGGIRPMSWTAKICHIMSPHHYPFIYDQYIRKVCSVSDVHQYELFLRDQKEKWINKSEEEIYRNDSELWASEL